MIGRRVIRVIRVIRGRRRRLAVINIHWWIPPSWLLKIPKRPYTAALSLFTLSLFYFI